MKNTDEFTSCLGMVVSFLVVAVLSIVMNGWAISTLWNWFVPSIFGLTTLTMGKALGLSLVAQVFTGRMYSDTKSEESSDSFTATIFKSLLKVIFVPTMTVFFGWIILQFAF